MSIHRSFRSSSTMEKHRNVLSRIERIARLEKLGRWNDSAQSVFNLPKLRNIKIRGKKKAAEEKPEEGVVAAEAGAAVPAAASAPGKAPAAGKAAADRKPAGKPGGKPGAEKK